MKRNLYYWVKNGEIYKVEMTKEEYNLAIKERKPVFKIEEVAKAYLNKDKEE